MIDFETLYGIPGLLRQKESASILSLVQKEDKVDFFLFYRRMMRRYKYEAVEVYEYMRIIYDSYLSDYDDHDIMRMV